VKCKYGRAALPPKYALELLTIYAWEMGTDKSDNFNMDYEDICIYWTKYYDFQNKIVRDFIKQQLKSSR
jgi:2'-5'-oligoadenylate synthase-like protein